ncbi:hypothetical protein PIB30_007600 [Stylosanthes scabra]|uniref:Uncharacterized protein n=1 Tax=Stylosanthes scabra TaxID=79078 RepID=A0ABU6U5N5_9FABA|nr:hypothetical protein [Stylosanthes scabra]
MRFYSAKHSSPIFSFSQCLASPLPHHCLLLLSLGIAPLCMLLIFVSCYLFALRCSVTVHRSATLPCTSICLISHFFAVLQLVPHIASPCLALLQSPMCRFARRSLQGTLKWS